MFIKQIRMIGYKRFHDLTIDLGENPKRIVALVGPNGCGKSSVFDAMIYLLRAYTGTVGKPTQNIRDYHYHSLRKEPSYDFQNVKMIFAEGSFEEIIENNRKTNKLNCIISFRSCFRYNGDLKVKESKAVDEVRLNSYGASSASDIDQRIEQNYRHLLGKYSRYRDGNDCKPSEAKVHIIGELNVALLNCLDLEINSLGNIDVDEGAMYFKKTDSDIIFDYNVLSSGEKEVVDILLDLYIRKDTFDNSIYVFDEPELHLNTSIQRSLLAEINKMVPPNCQIWLATHSIGFLRALQEELKNDTQIIEFKAENKWAAEAITLKPSTASRTMWQSIFSVALDDLTKLVCPKTIVYCEGRADPHTDGSERGLDAKVFNKVFESKYSDVQFVSSGGNTELDQRSDIALAIFSKVIPDLQLWVLKDRDMASGNETNEQDRQQYLKNNPESHRVLRRFEIENYLYDKEVLMSYCQINNLEFDEEKYDAIVTNIVDQNMKDITGRVKSCCNIVGSINQEKFKLNLANCILESMNVYHELEEIIFERK